MCIGCRICYILYYLLSQTFSFVIFRPSWRMLRRKIQSLKIVWHFASLQSFLPTCNMCQYLKYKVFSYNNIFYSEREKKFNGYPNDKLLWKLTQNWTLLVLKQASVIFLFSFSAFCLRTIIHIAGLTLLYGWHFYHFSPSHRILLF